LLSVLEAQPGRSLEMFSDGPWVVFGIVEEAVQSKVARSIEGESVVEGILYCKDGIAPSLDEYEKYLR
jgi:hypothetical protein